MLAINPQLVRKCSPIPLVITGLLRRMPMIVTTLGSSVSTMAMWTATIRIIVSMCALFAAVSDWRIGVLAAPAWLAPIGYALG